MISEKDALDLMEILYPYFIKKYKEDNSFKHTAMIVNGTAAENSHNEGTKKTKVLVKINPYDTDTISITNNTNDSFVIGNSLQILYYDSLKTAKIIAVNK